MTKESFCQCEFIEAQNNAQIKLTLYDFENSELKVSS